VALVSGGKDSCYNMMQCVANGHEIVALANLKPSKESGKDELDSFMYQTVGHDAIHFYAECMDLPLYRREILGSSVLLTPDYTVTRDDETEDLLCLLKDVMKEHPEVQAVSVGAILSNYQRIRVEHVCNRLGLISLAYLWRREQKELLAEMAAAGVEAVLIKVAAMGLTARHLGKTISEMYPTLCTMNERYDLHICGEGGEYETFTLDCPLFKKRIVMEETEIVTHSDAAFAPVAYLKFKKCRLEPKTSNEMRDISDAVQIPQWEQSWEKYEDIVRSMDRAPKHLALYDRPVADTIEGKCEGYITANRGDYFAISGTTAYSDQSSATEFADIEDETRQCMVNVQKRLRNFGLNWDNIVVIQVYVSNMADFARVNQVYKTFFDINPPPRALVGAPLPHPINLQVDVIARRFDEHNQKKTMHVQGMSYWAPANIGPYSQSVMTKELAFIAGQIGMIPSTLDLPQPQSIVSEAALSLRNLESITSVLQLDLVEDVAMCYCYVSDKDLLPQAAAAWKAYNEKENGAPPIIYIATSSLPKHALIEWQVVLGIRKSSYDDSDDDESHPAPGFQEPQIGSTTNGRDGVQVETTWWTSSAMYFAASCASLTGTAVSMDTVGGVLLSEIDQSISTFGTGWNTALCIKAFYQADPNSDDIGSTWETLIKQKLHALAPGAQPAVTMVPTDAIGYSHECAIGVSIQAVK